MGVETRAQAQSTPVPPDPGPRAPGTNVAEPGDNVISPNPIPQRDRDIFVTPSRDTAPMSVAKKRFEITKVAFSRPRNPTDPATATPAASKLPTPPIITVPFRKGMDKAIIEYNSKLNKYITTALNATMETAEYITENRPNAIKIHTSSDAAHSVVRATLKSNNIYAYTQPYHSNAPKTKRFVVYNLCDPDISQVKDDLEHYGLYPVDMKIMTIKRAKFPGHTNILVYFDEDDHITLDVVSKAKYICHTKVTWDHYRQTAPRQRQCENCLAPGHSSQYCDMPAKCFFCASQEHTATDCPLKAKKEELGANTIPTQYLKCANCGGQHTAVDKNCPSKLRYAEFLSKGNKRPPRTTRPEPRTVYIPAPPPTTNPWLETTTRPAPNQWPETQTIQHNETTAHDAPTVNAEWTVVRRKNKNTTPATHQHIQTHENRQPKIVAAAAVHSDSIGQVNTKVSNNIIKLRDTKKHVHSDNSNILINKNSSLFNTQELSAIFQEMVYKLRNCADKGEQLTALMDIALKYTPCHD